MNNTWLIVGVITTSVWCAATTLSQVNRRNVGSSALADKSAPLNGSSQQEKLSVAELEKLVQERIEGGTAESRLELELAVRISNAISSGRKANTKHDFHYWLARAANDGNAEAQYIVGDLCSKGLADDSSQYPQTKAAEWFFKAAAQSFPRAAGMVGLCYESGNMGVDMDLDKAKRWYTKGLEMGDSSCGTALWRNSKQSPARDESADAIKWLQWSAELGDPQAVFELAQCYWNGNHVNQDRDRAIALYRRSAFYGCTRAQSELASVSLAEQNQTLISLIEGAAWFIVSGPLGDFPIDNSKVKMTEQQWRDAERLAQELKSQIAKIEAAGIDVASLTTPQQWRIPAP
jgi:TPR repeat protein